MEVVEELCPSPSRGFLKLGKWEVPIESSSESTAFQFGSFGSFSDNNNNNNEEVKSKSSWGEDVGLTDPTPSTSSSSVWSSSSHNDSNKQINSLFPPHVSIGPSSSSSDPSPTSVSQPRPPPGLEQNNPNAIGKQQQQQQQQGSRSSSTINIKQPSPQQSTSLAYQTSQPFVNQSQSLPPGITTTTNPNNNNNRNNLSALPPPLSNPYNNYPPGVFDLSQTPFVHPSSYPQTSPSALSSSTIGSNPNTVNSSGNPPPVVSTTSNPTAAGGGGGNNSNSNPNTTSAQQQQQQYAPTTASFPYYGNPYYHNQAYFYGQQPLNYYGQGRGMYQPQRGPYGPDPYASNGSLYPGDVYQANQFADAPANYGGMSMHQPLSSSNQGGSVLPGSGVVNSKATKSAVNSSSSVQQGIQHSGPEHANNYGYANPYNSRGVGVDPQSWQYQQNQSAGWGAPMMSFPSSNASPTATGLVNQSFSQQPSQPQTHQQSNQSTNKETVRSSNVPYSNNPFPSQNSRSTGSSSVHQGNW